MRLTAFLPSGTRVRLRGGARWMRDTLTALRTPPRPVFARRRAEAVARPTSAAPNGVQEVADEAARGATEGAARAVGAPRASTARAADVFAVRFTRSGETVQVRAGETLLDSGLDAGLDLEFSCTMGGCGACMVRLVSGTVHMPEPHCLTAEEAAAGYILACIAEPRSTLEVEA